MFMDELKKLPILLYDEKCPLCVRFKQSLRRLEDGDKVNFVSIYNDEIYEHYKLSKEECFEEIHFIKEDKTIIRGEAVIKHIISLYPLASKFSWLLESNMGQKAVHYFHSMTNKMRKDLKRKCPSCTH